MGRDAGKLVGVVLGSASSYCVYFLNEMMRKDLSPYGIQICQGEGTNGSGLEDRMWRLENGKPETLILRGKETQWQLWGIVRGVRGWDGAEGKVSGKEQIKELVERPRDCVGHLPDYWNHLTLMSDLERGRRYGEVGEILNFSENRSD